MKKMSQRNKIIALIFLICLFIAFICINIKVSNNKQDFFDAVETSVSNEKTNNTAQIESKQEKTVQIRYVDTEGNSLLDSKELTKTVGEWYETEREPIEGYSAYKDEPTNKRGYMTEDSTDIVYTYQQNLENYKYEKKDNDVTIIYGNRKKSREYDVIVRTYDENRNQISGFKYQIKNDEKTFEPNGISESGDSFVGVLTAREETTKSYVLTQISAQKGYRKLKNKDINISLQQTWDKDEKIFKVVCNGVLPADVKVTVNEQRTGKEDGIGEIIIEIPTEQVKDAYDMEIVNKCGDVLISGTEFKITSENAKQKNESGSSEESTFEKQESVTNGKLEVGTFEILNEQTDIFQISEITTNELYKRVIEEGKNVQIKVLKEFNSDTEEYSISAECEEYPGITVDVQDDKVIITIESPENKYDLTIRKFVSKVDDKEISGREPEVTKTSDGDIVYNQTTEWVKVANTQHVTYTIRMYNETDTLAKGKRIIEHIPSGLVYLPEDKTNQEYGWELYHQNEDGTLEKPDEDTKPANVVVSDFLEGHKIQKYDPAKVTPNYLDVEIVFAIAESGIETSDRTIQNTASIEPNTFDDNKSNDTATETVKVKYFDLGIKKYIETIKVQNEITNSEKNIGLEHEGEKAEVVVSRDQVDETTLTIKYGLIITNNGEIEGSATQIADSIPDGLELLKDNETVWSISESDAKTAISEQLEDTIIQPGDSETIFVTFKYKLTPDNIGEKINVGKILASTNKYNAQDITPLDEDTEKFEVILTDEEPKKYDLSIQKFVSGIDGQEVASRNPKVEKNTDGKLQYVKPEDVEKVSNSQEITYTLRMYNESGVTAKGKRLIEYIPEGLTFLPTNEINKQYNWKLYNRDSEGTLKEVQNISEANVIATDYYVDAKIEPFNADTMEEPNFLDAKIVFKVNEDNVTTEDRTIKNIAEIQDNPNDDYLENNRATETVIVKKFDLNITKYIDSIKVKNEITDSTESIGLNKKSENIVVDVLRSQINRTTITIKYGLEIRNIGEIAGSASKITDTIPANFILSEESKEMWKQVENTAVTESLSTTKLEPGESTTIYITFDWNVKEDNIGARENISAITEYENDYLAKDITPNEDKVEFDTQIKEEKYDLAVKKFVSKIDEQEITTREPKATITEDGKVEYTQTEDYENVANSQNITYTIRTYNETDIVAYGKRIIEHIPQGLEFLPDNEINQKYDWKLYNLDEQGNLTEVQDVNEANVVVTDSLIDTKIDAFNKETMESPASADVQIVFKVNEQAVRTEDRTIKNTAEIVKNSNEDNYDNNNATETIIVKYFDLNITKYIDSIKVQDEIANTETVIGPDKKDEKVTVDILKSQINKAKVIVKYGLQIENKGEIAGYVTKVADTIPANFVLSEDNGENWRQEENIAITEQLADTILQPGESTTIYITFEWDVKEDNIGTRENIAEIAEYKNDFSAEDVTLNRDKKEFYTEVKEDKYDLSIQKFVSKINDQEVTNREPKAEIKEDGKIEYIQNGDIEKVENKQQITYTLRVYNESERRAIGKKIIENIPDGLEFLPDNETNINFGWGLYKKDLYGNLVQVTSLNDATVIATDYLVDKQIEAVNTNQDRKVDYQDVQIVFEVNEAQITSEDRTIENMAEIQKNVNDDNESNNKATEKIYVKYFDLDITKYIKEVTIKDSKKEKTIKRDENQKGELLKIDIPKDEIENTTITFTYGLKVTNTGEIVGSAKEIIDYIPKDFKLVEDSNWTIQDDKAVTRQLEDIQLKPGDNATIEIKFDWKVTKDNIGTKINSVKITEYENPVNSNDVTEDNEDKEEVIVQVQTGSIWIFTTLAVLVVLCLITIIVVILKKRANNSSNLKEENNG